MPIILFYSAEETEGVDDSLIAVPLSICSDLPLDVSGSVLCIYSVGTLAQTSSF
jgi:hypothetical protein